MTSINKFFSKISTQIAITVAMLCILLFMILNIIVIQQSKSSFENVIQAIKVQPITGYEYQPRFIIREQYPYGYIQVFPSYEPYEQTTFMANQDGTLPTNPLQERFSRLFQSSLFGVALLAIMLSIVIGFLVAKIFSNPLNLLSSGMKKLRDSNYKFKLDKTGTDEFDKVIDEFNTLTQELQKVEDLRKDLISDTSHELKTPITSLIGQLQGVKDGVFEMDKERIDLLISQVNRLDDLVENLQEFSRIRNKVNNVEKSKVEGRKLVKKVMGDFKSELSKKKIKVNLNIDKDFEIEADEEMLERVFINLISNTLKYSKAKNIFIEAKGNEIKYSDDGIGVDEEHLPYLFERFYRVEKSRNRKTGGLGLGLAIVKEIVEAHGWRVSVGKREKGGLEFVIN